MMRWLEKAAKNDHTNAAYWLGRSHLVATESPPRDMEKALHWLKLGAENGDVDCKINLARLFEQGCGVPRDFQQAAAYYRQAAEQLKEGDAEDPDACNAPDVWTRMGQYCLLGLGGVARDRAEAVRWFELASKEPFMPPDPYLVMGFAYSEGVGVEQDFKQAYKWFKIAGLDKSKTATKSLPMIAERLSPEERREAEKLYDEW